VRSSPFNFLQNPHISASMDEDAGMSMSDEQSLKHWFGKLQELRTEVEQVRGTLCNKYAKDMGDNLNCAQQ